jgi:hypothetical protein
MFLFLPCSDGCGMGCEKGTDDSLRFDCDSVRRPFQISCMSLAMSYNTECQGTGDADRFP